MWTAFWYAGHKLHQPKHNRRSFEDGAGEQQQLTLGKDGRRPSRQIVDICLGCVRVGETDLNLTCRTQNKNNSERHSYHLAIWHSHRPVYNKSDTDSCITAQLPSSALLTKCDLYAVHWK